MESFQEIPCGSRNWKKRKELKIIPFVGLLVVAQKKQNQFTFTQINGAIRILAVQGEIMN